MTVSPPALAALHARCFTVPRPWTEAEIAALLQSPATVLVGDGEAFALGRVAADEAELLTIAVAPQLRRAGRGGALLSAFETAARSRGARHAFLEVAADNRPALALYRSHGYREVGRRPDYYAHPAGHPVDALVLRRDLCQG